MPIMALATAALAHPLVLSTVTTGFGITYSSDGGSDPDRRVEFRINAYEFKQTAWNPESTLKVLTAASDEHGPRLTGMPKYRAS